VRFLAGAAAGFLIPVLPFATMAPGRFYDDVVKAQLVRASARTPLSYRLQQLTGLTGWHPTELVAAIVAVIMVAGVGAALIGASLATRRRPAALEWFAVAVAGLVAVAFLVPDNFYYHYPAFFGPFFAMALALPAARLIANAGGWLPRAAVGVAALAIVVLPIAVPRAENSQQPTFSAAIAALTRVIPKGACVATDQASLLISANRFVSSVPGCVPVVDGFGTSYALAGRNAEAAGAIAAVAKLWKQAFDAAQYVLLTQYNARRIAWTPELRVYLRTNFAYASGPWPGLALYVRKSPALTGG
jgi:hypothetical protein